MAKKKKEDVPVLSGYCSVVLYLFLYLFVVGYALYFREGYTRIATNKFTFFRFTGIGFACLFLPVCLVERGRWLYKNGTSKAKQYFSQTDLFVFFYLMVQLISFLTGSYKDEALWGTSGWNMGLVTQLLCILIYYAVSRYYVKEPGIINAIMGTCFTVFLWGLLNRFSVYPIEMQFSSPTMISSMGNINWLCGYWAVFFVTGPVLYWLAEEKKVRVITGIFSVVALGFGVVEGSDSAYLSLFVLYFVLFLFSFRDWKKLKRFTELLLFLLGSCQVFWLITLLAPNALNFHDSIIDFMAGSSTLPFFILSAGFRILLEWAAKKKKDIRRIAVVRKITGYFMVVLFVGYLLVLIINTCQPQLLALESPLFTFNGEWGSARGTTWMDGLLIYKSLPLRERLFGVGQDCFWAYAIEHPVLGPLLESQFGNSRLTNAHNECITILVNTGAFGLVCFLGIIGSSTKRLLKKAKEEPVLLVFAIGILSYFVHNMFSFSQLLNTPYFFLMLGLGEWEIRTYIRKSA